MKAIKNRITNQDLMVDVDKKFNLLITSNIFLIIVIKTFFENYKSIEAEKVYLAFTILVAISLLNYLFFFLVKKKLINNAKKLFRIDFLMTLALFSIPLIIVFLLSTESLNNLPQIFLNIFTWLILIASLAVIFIPIWIFSELLGLILSPLDKVKT